MLTEHERNVLMIDLRERLESLSLGVNPVGHPPELFAAHRDAQRILSLLSLLTRQPEKEWLFVVNYGGGFILGTAEGVRRRMVEDSAHDDELTERVKAWDSSERVDDWVLGPFEIHRAPVER